MVIFRTGFLKAFFFFFQMAFVNQVLISAPTWEDVFGQTSQSQILMDSTLPSEEDISTFDFFQPNLAKEVFSNVAPNIPPPQRSVGRPRVSNSSRKSTSIVQPCCGTNKVHDEKVFITTQTVPKPLNRRARKQPTPIHIKATTDYQIRRKINTSNSRISRERRKVKEQSRLKALNKILETNAELKSEIQNLTLQLNQLIQLIQAKSTHTKV